MVMFHSYVSVPEGKWDDFLSINASDIPVTNQSMLIEQFRKSHIKMDDNAHEIGDDLGVVHLLFYQHKWKILSILMRVVMIMIMIHDHAHPRRSMMIHDA